jgi:hypothetical protein
VEVVGRARHTWTKSLCSPLGPEIQNWEFSPQTWQRMVACAMEFLFEAEQQAYVNQQLVALWNSVDLSFSTSSLIACSVLEGLCNQTNEPVPTVLTKSQLKLIQELVASDGFSEISVNPMDLAGRKELATRVNNALAPLNNKNAGNLLKMWCSAGKYGLHPGVAAAWRSLRNRPAHGQFDLFDVEEGKRAKLVDQRNTVYQGINAILLSQMGYRGPIFDWIEGKIRDF